jgi:cytochrome c biogenesis protein CcdA
MTDVVLALMAGVLTIAAPCILPMLPILLGTSVGQHSRSRPVFIVVGFIATFSAVALLFAASSEVLGLSPDVLRHVAVALLASFGVLMLWKRPFDHLAQRLGRVVNAAHALGQRGGAGRWGGLLLGMTLGVVWTPCAGPVLGSILTLIATEPDSAKAGTLLVAYALGAGVPMLVIAYGGQYITTRVGGLVRYAVPIQQVFGGLIILTALAMHYQYDIALTVWLSGGPNVLF